jgi:hypothetical protein
MLFHFNSNNVSKSTSNSLLYFQPESNHIVIKSNFCKIQPTTSTDFALKCDHYHISVSDNGIGFKKFSEKNL